MKSHLVLVSVLLVPTNAFAQADANPVKSAGDAFGHKRGDEAIGLYDEKSVRGFSLEAAGNYRLNGTYFVKNSGVANFFIDSSAVRIGYNTLDTILPGPSGVVDYRLRDPRPGEKSQVTFTADIHGQPILELNLRHGSPSGRASYSLGLSRNFDVRNGQGGKGGEDLLVGGIGRLTYGSLTAQLFAGEYQYRRRGEYRVVPLASALPGRIARKRYLGPDWAFDQGQRRIAGLLVDHALSPHAGIGATLAFGQEDPTRAFTPFFRVTDEKGGISADLLAVPQQRSTAWSGEGRAHIEHKGGAGRHRLDLLLRHRISTARYGGARSYSLGSSELGEALPDFAQREHDLRADQHIRVEQTGIGLSYRGGLGDRLRWNMGALQSFYSKHYSNAAGAATSTRSSPLLYNAGAAFELDKGVELFASYSRGLEEAGIAPSAASNRNEILDTIIVRQSEFGLKWRLPRNLTLLAAAFDTRKPYAGIDPATNIYRFLGTVRHRGIELSLSGRPIDGLQIVAGGVALDPVVELGGPARVGGELKPVAVPRYRAILNADYAVPGVKGLSLDVGLNHLSRRAARSSLAPDGQQLHVPALTTLNAGFRLAGTFAGRETTARLQILNLTNRFAWDVNSSETLAYVEARRLRLLLTAKF